MPFSYIAYLYRLIMVYEMSPRSRIKYMNKRSKHRMSSVDVFLSRSFIAKVD